MNRRQTLTIQTPEGIVFSLETANPVTRFLALAIDQVCIYIVVTVLTAVVRMVGFISSDLAGALWMLLTFAAMLGYPIALEWFMRGQTVGKKLLRLRVMDVQALRLTFSQVVVRNLLRFVDALPGLYLLGGVTSLVNSRGQRLGDIAANTLVIYQPRVPEPDLEQILPGKFNSFRAYPHLAARLRQNIEPREAGIYLRALLRRDALEDLARVSLFRELRRTIETAVTFPSDVTESISDEQYVRNVVDILFRPATPRGKP